MNEERPIDNKRDSGGVFNVGTEEDGGIMETYDLNGRLLVIKEKSVYEVIFADTLDPKRENLILPSTTQRLLLTIGTESELFSRTFLTAKRLFDKKFLRGDIATDKALELTFELVIELNILDDEIQDYISIENKTIANYEERKSKNLDHSVPSIPDIRTRCKTIFQKADHVLQAQMDIIRLFYPEFNGTSYYKSFYSFLESKYGEQDHLVMFLRNTISFIMTIRNIRNCLDHRRSEIRINDFELQSTLEIHIPTIEIDYLESKLDKVSLAQYFSATKENLLSIFEYLIAYLCSKFIKSERILPSKVSFIPQERRRNKFAKFAYWSPLGDGGYFYQ